MKRNRKKYFIKGIYGHPQVSGYFVVKQYMMIEKDDRHCLLLRFENQLKTTVQTVEFTVKQLDADGKSIGKIKIKYTDLSVKAGALYAPEQGIVLQDECVDFVIQMKYVISENVKYLYRKGLVTAHYNPRGFEDIKEESTPSKNKIAIKPKYWGGGKNYRRIALLSLALMILMFWFFAEQSKDSYQKQDPSKEVNGSNEIEVSMIQQNDQ